MLRQDLKNLVDQIEKTGVIAKAIEWKRDNALKSDKEKAPTLLSWDVDNVVISFKQLKGISEQNKEDIDLKDLKTLEEHLETFETLVEHGVVIKRDKYADDTKERASILGELQTMLLENKRSIQELKILIVTEKNKKEAEEKQEAERKEKLRKAEKAKQKQEDEQKEKEKQIRKEKEKKIQEEREKQIQNEEKVRSLEERKKLANIEQAKKNPATKILLENLEIKKENIRRRFFIKLKQILTDSTASLKAEAVMQQALDPIVLGKQYDDKIKKSNEPSFSDLTDKHREHAAKRSVLQKAIKEHEANPVTTNGNFLDRFYPSTEAFTKGRKPDLDTAMIDYAMFQSGVHEFVDEETVAFKNIDSIGDMETTAFLTNEKRELNSQLKKEGENYLKDNKKEIENRKKQFINDTESYLGNIFFRHSRKNSAERLLNFIKENNFKTHEDVVKVLKAEYEAQIDYDKTSKKLIEEGSLAKAIRAHLLKLGVDALELFAPKLPFEELTHTSALQLLSYIDKTERSFYYKIKPDVYNEELTEIGDAAHQLLLCKTNAQLNSVKELLNRLYEKYKGKESGEILENINEDIEIRLKQSVVARLSAFNSNDADVRMKSLYEECIDELANVSTNKEVVPNNYSNKGRFQLKYIKSKPIGIENKPDKHSLRDEVIGKLTRLIYDPNIDNTIKLDEMLFVIQKAKEELKPHFFNLYGLLGTKSDTKFTEALNKVEDKIKTFDPKPIHIKNKIHVRNLKK